MNEVQIVIRLGLLEDVGSCRQYLAGNLNRRAECDFGELIRLICMSGEFEEHPKGNQQAEGDVELMDFHLYSSPYEYGFLQWRSEEKLANVCHCFGSPFCCDRHDFGSVLTSNLGAV